MNGRKHRLEALGREEFDVAIIGGGINGAVAAAALAGHGVKVALIEKQDFASGVSSQSSGVYGFSWFGSLLDAGVIPNAVTALSEQAEDSQA